VLGGISQLLNSGNPATKAANNAVVLIEVMRFSDVYCLFAHSYQYLSIASQWRSLLQSYFILS
jgi:hypothetical protein